MRMMVPLRYCSPPTTLLPTSVMTHWPMLPLPNFEVDTDKMSPGTGVSDVMFLMRATEISSTVLGLVIQKVSSRLVEPTRKTLNTPRLLREVAGRSDLLRVEAQ